MRFNSEAYDKVFPRETEEPEPESSVPNFPTKDESVVEQEELLDDNSDDNSDDE